MENDVDVLIVGAGPTGLTLACELLRRGTRVTIIDAAPVPATTSRAMVVHSRTLEIFAAMRIVDSVVSRGVQGMSVHLMSRNKRLLSISFDELDAPYPGFIVIPQVETERILEQALNALGGRVERGTRNQVPENCCVLVDPILKNARDAQNFGADAADNEAHRAQQRGRSAFHADQQERMFRVERGQAIGGRVFGTAKRTGLISRAKPVTGTRPSGNWSVCRRDPGAARALWPAHRKPPRRHGRFR